MTDNSDGGERVKDVKRWYAGEWAGFKFIEDGKHYTVVCQESYSSKWVLCYRDPSTKMAGGGITISDIELRLKLLPILMDMVLYTLQPGDNVYNDRQ